MPTQHETRPLIGLRIPALRILAREAGCLTFEQSRDRQVAILRASAAYRVSAFAEVVDELGETTDEDDFDGVLACLYDECDRYRIWLDPIR